MVKVCLKIHICPIIRHGGSMRMGGIGELVGRATWFNWLNDESCCRVHIWNPESAENHRRSSDGPCGCVLEIERLILPVRIPVKCRITTEKYLRSTKLSRTGGPSLLVAKWPPLPRWRPTRFPILPTVGGRDMHVGDGRRKRFVIPVCLPDQFSLVSADVLIVWLIFWHNLTKLATTWLWVVCFDCCMHMLAVWHEKNIRYSAR
jgi:hypothetical protein